MLSMNHISCSEIYQQILLTHFTD